MKHNLILFLAAALTGLSAQAQGFFNFSNYGAAAGGNAPIYDYDIPCGNGYRADFIWSADAGNGYIDSGTGPTVAFAGNGYFLGNKQVIDGQTGTITLQVRVWNSAIASTYDRAVTTVGAHVGISDPISLTLATGNNQPPGMVAAGFRSFNIAPIPEPSTVVLGGIGLALIMFIRRK